MRRVMLVCLVTIGMAAPALAQDDRPVHIFLGGGPVFPSSGFKNDFNTGGIFAAGATFWITPNIGIQGEYNYNHMNGPEKTITVTPSPTSVVGSNQLLESNHQVHAGIFDLVGRTNHHDSLVNGYFLGGGGLYHRIIQVTSPAVGYTTYCDPYWLVCYPAAVSVDNILGSRSSNDFGMNVGGGVTIGHEVKFYVEMRYTYVWGPKVGPNNVSSNAVYWPLTFGLTF